MFRTITAKFPGSRCKRCGAVIEVGERIRYGGTGRTYHFADACNGKPITIEGEIEPTHAIEQDGTTPIKMAEAVPERVVCKNTLVFEPEEPKPSYTDVPAGLMSLGGGLAERF